PNILDRLNAKKAEGPLSGVLRLAAQQHHVVAGLNPSSLIKLIESEEPPPQAALFRPLLYTELATLVFDHGKETRVDVRVRFADGGAAKGAGRAGEAILTLGRQFFQQLKAAAKGGKGGLPESWAQVLTVGEAAVQAVKELQAAKDRQQNVEVQV